MVRARRLILLLAALWGWAAAASGAADVADTRQGCLDDAFRSLQVVREGDPQGLAVIALGVPSDRIVISFDELTDERTELRYELIHCDTQWRPSRIVESEYLDGFNQADVDDWAYSRATLVHYVNYRITIPNEQMRPLVSGNYLVRVYPEDDPDRTVVQARFRVTEQTMAVSASVSSRTDIDYNDAHQQLSLAVDTRGTDLDSPYTDLQVLVAQNGRTDNAVWLTTPLKVTGTTAVFEHQRPLIFDAGNEYRRFETVTTRYRPMGVADIWPPRGEGDTYLFELAADEPRAASRYNYDSTQHGRFLVREANAADSDTEADYVMVKFTLRAPSQEDRGGVYLDGDFTGRRLDGGSRMVYNTATGLYESWQLLKQGHYNYLYLVPGAAEGATAPVEGNKFETVNEYAVYVYYRPRMGRYDRLAAVHRVFSGR